MAKAKTADDTTTYECVMAHSMDVDGAALTVRHGQVVRPDHVAYRANPGFFVPVGTPHDERPTLVDFVTVAGTHTEPPRRRPDGWRRDRHPADDWAD